MDVIFKDIYMNRIVTDKLCKVTKDICNTVCLSGIFMIIGLHYTRLKIYELEKRIEYLELKGDNTSKKGE